ncbi:MAG TPA: toxin TcdB middle/C-terminal domain-containing protein [Pyrinomonadaceae bacterium]
MSGDGLSDLVRVRNGEVSYWPSLGYGRFGAKVTMNDAPVFDAPDIYDPRRVRLADTDGSGMTDLLYLAGDGVRIYSNRSGNGFSAPYRLANFPPVDNVADIGVVDLLGNGTACLVWSTPLPGGARAPLRYVDLMGGTKPHLLAGVKNNLGAETEIQYASSTRFYVEDMLAGRSWITRLPFPVHLVERTVTFDLVSRNRFVTSYSYHHGYFDGVEREFRGFGMVEQQDTEEFAAFADGGELPPAANSDPASRAPPVLTRTWFHTGVHTGRDRVSNFFAGLLDEEDAGEYYREPGLTDDEARRRLLDDSVLPPGLSAEEEREACRALKGAMLRQEVFAHDGTAKEPHPYAVTEQNFSVRLVQPAGANRHAVFFTHPLESITYHYERDPEDPRVAHTLTLEVDGFGNVLKSASAAYARRRVDETLEERDRARQRERHVIYTESRVTNFVDGRDARRTPQPCESRAYELTGLALPADGDRFTLDDLLADAAAAGEIAYEQRPAAGLKQKRLIEHERMLFRGDDLAPLPFSRLESLGLPLEGYKLAFTAGLVEGVYGTRITDEMLSGEGRYVHGRGEDDAEDDDWWIPTGRVFYSPGASDDAPTELAFARQHFFLPRRFRDPFGSESAVGYDADANGDPYDLLPASTRDALGNEARAAYDYRVLQPRLVTDQNGNRSEAAFDALGMVAGTAVMGRENESSGDRLDASFRADLSDAEIDLFLLDPAAAAAGLLANATTRVIYDLHRFAGTAASAGPRPVFAATLARETHFGDLGQGESSKIQIGFSYSDGFGREIQKKAQAEPGAVEANGPDVDPRWVGSGWVVFNNKGNPIRQFEPFFTPTHEFEFDVRKGVSPYLFYDPTGRVVATLRPDHTWEKVIFDPWRQETWDGNDTALIADPATDADAADFFRRLPRAEYLPTWHALRTDAAHADELAEKYPDADVRASETAAAAKTAVHSATPLVAHSDTLGRAFLTVAHNRFKYGGEPTREEFQRARVVFDIEGNQREVIDAEDRAVMRYDYDMLGARIHQASMEAGERWSLADVAGNPVRASDSLGRAFRTEYDELRRATVSFVAGTSPQEPGEKRTQVSVYGERAVNAPPSLNLRGRLLLHCDGAGLVVNAGTNPETGREEAYDFKGNPLRASRRIAREYKKTVDWNGADWGAVEAALAADQLQLAAVLQPLSAMLEPETFTSSTTYDGFNRPVAVTTPDRSVHRPVFNEANLLEKVEVNLRGDAAVTRFVTDIDYDAKGQRTSVAHGNGVRTSYEYDPQTFRLVRLQTTRGSVRLQDLRYTYDPAGNITHVRDDAQQDIFFDNSRVEPAAEYNYDSLYSLIEATGREHLGQIGAEPAPHSHDDVPRVNVPHPADRRAMGLYAEQYFYDAAGNFRSMKHRGSSHAHTCWTRDYDYDEVSQLEPARNSNRLSRTTIGRPNSQPAGEPYTHDLHGNITRMPHLPLMLWDYRDQLQATSRQVVNEGTPETTYYAYDAAGQRTRKVTEREAAPGQTPSRKSERIYLGGFELYREYAGGGAVTLERETLHVMDDTRRVALVETRTDADGDTPPQLVRYQFGNHLGSASLELDGSGQIISYEEYYPYGSTSYQAVRGNLETSPKRYRHTGMERDEENGFNYHSARYCALWLGRWVSCDPVGIAGGLNLYGYVLNNPLRLSDPLGTQPQYEETFYPSNRPPDAQGVYYAGEQVISIVDTMPPLGDDEAARRAGTTGIVPRDEHQRQRDFNARQHPLYKELWPDQAAEAAWYAAVGEEAVSDYYNDLQTGYNEYRRDEAVKLRENWRRTDVAVGAVNEILSYLVTGATLGVGVGTAGVVGFIKQLGFSALLAGSTSEGGFSGCGAVAGLGGGALPSLEAKAATELLTGFNATESAVINEARTILGSAELAKLRAAHAAGQSVEVRIGGRLIQYEPGLNASGMTMFGENGFLIGRGAFVSEAELGKTFLHELYRLGTSASSGGVSASLVKSETEAAFNFAERAIGSLF